MGFLSQTPYVIKFSLEAGVGKRKKTFPLSFTVQRTNPNTPDSNEQREVSSGLSPLLVSKGALAREKKENNILFPPQSAGGLHYFQLKSKKMGTPTQEWHFSYLTQSLPHPQSIPWAVYICSLSFPLKINMLDSTSWKMRTETNSWIHLRHSLFISTWNKLFSRSPFGSWRPT